MKMLLLFSLLVHQVWAVCRPHLRLEDNLDEPKNLGFCADVHGYKTKIDFEKPMQVSWPFQNNLTIVILELY